MGNIDRLNKQKHQLPSTLRTLEVVASSSSLL